MTASEKGSLGGSEPDMKKIIGVYYQVAQVGDGSRDSHTRVWQV